MLNSELPGTSALIIVIGCLKVPMGPMWRALLLAISLMNLRRVEWPLVLKLWLLKSETVGLAPWRLALLSFVL